MNGETFLDITKDCPCDPDKWCYLKELIRHNGLSDFNVEQIRLVYDHKFLMSEKAGKDVGKEAAWNSWINDGFAERFREIYKEGMKHEELKYIMFVERW